MKTKLFTLFVSLALLAGCAKNEITREPVQVASVADHITLAPTTTRATTSTLDELKSGFRTWVRAHGASNANAWYTDGITAPDALSSYTHVWNETESHWEFSPGLAWPGTETAAGANSGYPLEFMAVYPALSPRLKLDPMYVGQFSPLLEYISIAHPVTDAYPDPALGMVDIVVGTTGSVVTRPANSTANITFRHIFAKLDFEVKVDEGFTARIQALGVKNFIDQGYYDIPAQRWTGGGSNVNNTAFNYFNYFVPNGTGNAVVIEDAAVVPNGDDRHLMVVPQNLNDSMWNPENGAPEKNYDSHIQMMYSLTASSDGGNIVGYDYSGDHPDWQAGDYEGILFVKAGWAFEGNWEQGKGYTYRIELPGETGGNILDNYYYDDHGNRTKFIIAGKKIGDPVIGDVSGGYIQLPGIVEDWDTPTAETDVEN